MSISIQTANIWKRISAWMFDAIMAIMLALGCCLIVVTAINFDSVVNKYNAYLQQYRIEYGAQYDVDLNLSEEDYNKFSAQEKEAYDEKRAEAQNEMDKALAQDEGFIEISSKLFSSTLFIIAVGILGSHLILHVLVPLLFKNGQTLGKKIFGLAVVRSNSVKASNLVLFIREIIGLYAMETMFPLLIVLMIYFGYLGIIGTATLLLFLILQLGVMIKTPTNSSIHDLLSDTIVVDLLSQRIFETEEERVEYLAEEQRLAEENPGVY